MVKVSRRRVQSRRPRAVSDVEAAHRMLADLGAALEVAILVQDVEGDGPVVVRATVMYGTDVVEVEVEGATEAEALAELGYRAIAIRGADPSWIRRYGFGAG